MIANELRVMLKTNTKKATAIVLSLLSIRKKPLPSEFALTLTIPAGREAKPGKISFTERPWQKDIIDSIAEYGIIYVVIIAPTQFGKSFIQQVWMAYNIVWQTGGCIYVGAKQQDAINHMEAKWVSFVKVNKCLYSRLVPGRHSLTALKSKFSSGTVLTEAGQSEAAASNKTCSLLCADEPDKYGDPTILQGWFSRFKSFDFNGKAGIVCSPTLEGSTIDKVFKQGDMNEWFVPCLKCGEMWHYTWIPGKTIVWDMDARNSDGSWNVVKVMDSARIKCTNPECGHLHDDADRIKQQLDPRAGFRPTCNPDSRRPEFKSFAVNGLMGPGKYNTIRDLVEKYISYESPTNTESRKRWWNESFGVNYEPDKEMNAAVDSTRMALQGVKRGEIPKIPGFKPNHLIAGVDVQENCFYARFDVYDMSNVDSLVPKMHTVEWGVFDTLDGVDAAMQFILSQNKELKLGWAGAIDTNFANKGAPGSHTSSKKVVNWIAMQNAKHDRTRWYGARGQGNNNSHVKDAPWFMGSIDIGSGEKKRGAYDVKDATSIPCLLARSDEFKSRQMKYLLKADGYVWTYPAIDVDNAVKLNDFLMQVTSEERRTVKPSAHHPEGYEWYAKRKDNHLWDCWTYSLCLATWIYSKRIEVMAKAIADKKKEEKNKPITLPTK